MVPQKRKEGIKDMMVNVLTGEAIRNEDVLKKEVKAESMIYYLQCMMDEFKAEEARYGKSDYLMDKLDNMIACKEMVEAMIGYPVNLQKDGKVTLGLL